MTIDEPVKEYKVLTRKKNSETALNILKRLTSQVKPILVKRSWTIKHLCEFFPTNPNLLVNVNSGWKINLRLRPHFDDTQFLEYEDILGTLLHEIAHIVRGPHDAQFYKLLEELKTETEMLMASGYHGEGFYSKGHRLGTSSSLPSNLRIAAAAAAEKRQRLSKLMLPTGGVRLGGIGDDSNISPSQLAAMAAQRRLQDKLWCGGSQTIVIESSDDEENVTKDRRNKRRLETDHGDDRNQKKGCVTPHEKDAWICSACTFRNQPLVLVCEVCLFQRPTASDSDHWMCPQCTLINERKRQTCTACDFIKGTSVQS
ncbi:WLM-domain-containing protein [Rhizopus microsporus ATCC 52813]|uniref:WLM-domain-containing protein n=1 Tax=Rhizopus microsporus ATCC 52813 TaxID=1340429 RepID=A0A2G4T8N4_RHIZD|nr:WLM-domain-containing protein [Rhizopus microsporus ATCC 52813]PHZ17357.1 WLM-domain-containing protein [Rhizopus microsporus ATCC 52813]